MSANSPLILEYEDARNYIITHPENILEKAKVSGYICPCCVLEAESMGLGFRSPKEILDILRAGLGTVSIMRRSLILWQSRSI